MMEFNYLLEQACAESGGDGKYSIDYAGMAARSPGWISSYSRSRPTETARAWRHGLQVRRDAAGADHALESTADIPVDITPEFELARGVRP